MYQLAKNIWEYRNAFFTLVYTNLKTDVVGTRLGFIWWVLDPLLLMAIYYVFMVIILNRGGPNFHIFALCGIVAWQAFARSISMSTATITRNRGIIKQIAIPMEMLIIVPAVVQSIFCIFGFTIIAVWNYSTIGLHSIAAIFLPPLIVPLSFSIGIFGSILEVYIKDSSKFIKYFLRIGFFLTPVLYSPERVLDSEKLPEIVKFIFLLNPMVHFISAARAVLFEGRMYDIKNLVFVFLISLIAIQVSLWVFRMNRNNIVKYL